VGQHLNRQNRKEIHLKIAGAALLGLCLLFGTTTFAQDSLKMEVSGDYSYMRFNPQNNNISRRGAFSLNGGGGAFTYFLTNMIAIKAEFEGYGSTTRTFPGGAHSNAFVNICNVGGGCIGNPSNNAFDFIIGGGVDIPVTKSIASGRCRPTTY
jgi:hypothetical protein